MNLVHPILSSWIHDADPIDSLEINKVSNMFLLLENELV